MPVSDLDPTEQIRVAVAFHSGYGHTACQAQAVAEGARDLPGSTVDLVRLDQLTDTAWAILHDADAIVFGSPTYMGGPSSVFRAFAEETSRVMADGLRWRDKIAAGFTTSGSMSGDKLNTLVDLAVFAAQHGMIWVGLAATAGWNRSTGSIEDVNRLGSWLGAMAQAHADLPPDVVPPETDLRTARILGHRVAAVTRTFRLGARAGMPVPAGAGSGAAHGN